MEHPGFKLFSNLVDEQRRSRVKEIVGMEADSLDSLIKLGNLKKELAGIQFAAALPQIMVDSLNDEIIELLEIIRGEEDEMVS